MTTDYQFGRWLSSPPLGEEVVITGISGRFPESDNVHQLQKHLFDKCNITTEDSRRWDPKLPGVPRRFGKINDIETFDAGFFAVHHRRADAMSPMLRKSLEIATEAILDAGVNPSELKGSKTAVFSATAPVFSDVLVSGKSETQKLRISNSTTSDISHRISYFLKVKGVSCGVEMDCSGSFIALDMAVTSLRLGKCDNAIVIACNLLQHPEVSRELAAIGILSPEGISRVFDEDADGYVRSEALACVFLQRAKSAKRIYAKLVHIKVGCDGYKLSGITVPSTQTQTQLIQSTLSESGISPSTISYFEAHGTGTKVGDPHEADSIDTAIAKNRQTPLLVGAIKNNIGHSEASSGLCSVVKAIIAMETGLIPPTINVKRVKKGIAGFEQKRMRVVTDTEQLPEDAYIGINCFGWGGDIGNLILHRFGRKRADDGSARVDISRLVLVSGRSRDAVLDLVDNVTKQPDEEYLALLQEIFKDNVAGHLYRGFAILDNSESIKTSVKYYSQHRRDLVVFFGAFEDNFQLLEKHLLNVAHFRRSTERIFKSFRKQRLTIDEDLSNLKKYETLNAFAVQLAVLEVLKILKIELEAVSSDLLHNLLVLYYNDKIDLKQTITVAHQMMTNGQWKNNCCFSDSPFISKHTTVLNIADRPLRNKRCDMHLTQNLTLIIGRLYQQGHNPQVQKLYPDVKFPVRRKTPMISHMVKWNHSKNWHTYKFSEDQNYPSLQKIYKISYENFEYLRGYRVDGICRIPVTETLRLVCQTFKPWLDSPLVLENCEFLEHILMPKSGSVRLLVSIFPVSGKFEVCKDDTLVACGRIFVPEDIKMYQTDSTFVSECNDDSLILTPKEIYRELNLKGYNYSGLFEGVECCNLNASRGLLRWKKNWTTFLDSLLQIVVLQHNTKSLCLPVGIRRLTIDTSNHMNGETSRPFCVHNGVIRSGGVEMFGVVIKHVKRYCHQTPVLSKRVFVPNVATLSLEESVRVNLQIIVDTSIQSNIKAMEMIDNDHGIIADPLLPLMHKIIEEIPLVTSDFTISSKCYLGEYFNVTVKNVSLASSQNLLLVIATNVLERPTVLQSILSSLCLDGFIIAREDRQFDCKKVKGFEVLTENVTTNEKLILLQKSKFTDDVESTKRRLTVSENKSTCCTAVDFPFFHEQVKKNFPVSILKDYRWGTYRYLPIKHDHKSTSRFCCDKDKTYIIVEGLSDLGLEIADWLIANGARKVVLVSKNKIQTTYQKRKLSLWKSFGTVVVVTNRNIEEKETCLQIIEDANNLGSIDGIFNLFAVKVDVSFDDQTINAFNAFIEQQARVAISLDEISRNFCQQLRYFVTFSSLPYNIGQNVCPLASSTLERVCEKRREDDLPGLVIQWGPIEDVGVSLKPEQLNLQGLAKQTLSSCLDVLGELLQQTDPVVSSMVVAQKNNANSTLKNNVAKIAYAIGIKNIKRVDTDSTLAEIGIDSIGGAQVVEFLELDFGISLSLEEVRSLTVAKLIEMVEK